MDLLPRTPQRLMGQSGINYCKSVCVCVCVCVSVCVSLEEIQSLHCETCSCEQEVKGTGSKRNRK